MLLAVHDRSAAFAGGLPVPLTRNATFRLPCTLSASTAEPARKGNDCALLNSELLEKVVDCTHDAGIWLVVVKMSDVGLADLSCLIIDSLSTPVSPLLGRRRVFDADWLLV